MRNKNCILCKYRKDENACYRAIMSNTYCCPTLTNIYYTKLIYHFPFNLIYKIQVKVWKYRAEKEYEESHRI